MKRILFAIIAVLSLVAAQAQTTYTNPTSGNRTITAADTLLAISTTSIPSKIRAIQYVYTETSGTTAGKVYLEGSIDNTNYVLIDSLTLADVATAQTKLVVFPASTGTVYRSLRWRNTNTSSATAAVRSWMLRRHDD